MKLSDYDFSDLNNYPNVGYDREGNLTEFSFNGNSYLRPAYTKMYYTKEALEEWLKCQDNEIYFFENYLKIQTIDHGIIPFKLRDYQYEYYDVLKKNKKVILMQCRQSGKTVSTAAYIVHKIIFKKEFNVGIVANTNELTLEIVSMIKQMFELLPAWLKPGIKKWNARSIVLDNGNKIYSAVAGPSAMRGKSLSFLLCNHKNELITIKHKKSNKIETITFDEFFNRI